MVHGGIETSGGLVLWKETLGGEDQTVGTGYDLEREGRPESGQSVSVVPLPSSRPAGLRSGCSQADIDPGRQAGQKPRSRYVG